MQNRFLSLVLLAFYFPPMKWQIYKKTGLNEWVLNAFSTKNHIMIPFCENNLLHFNFRA